MIKMMLLAGLGGFAGTCARFLFIRCCATIFHGNFPLCTFAVNIIGCLVMGLLLGLLEKTQSLTASQGLMLTTGFCGGFTTFSAFAADALLLGDKARFAASAVYLLASVILGVLLVWAGRALIR